MPKIINLSCLFKLNSVYDVTANFAELCDKYSQPSWFSTCCFGFFQRPTNLAWVMWQYTANLETVINPYKRGEITTEEFLIKFLDIFSFLLRNDLEITQEDIARINLQEESYFVLQDKANAEEDLEKSDYLKALIEEAWNSIVELSSENKIIFETIFSRDDPVYLVSNTNELNVFKILRLLQSHYPNVEWFENVDVSVPEAPDKTPLQIAPNIYLCLSYRWGEFKYQGENLDKIKLHTTPGLLRDLICELDEQNFQREEFHIISQYPRDIKVATDLGVRNCHLYSGGLDCRLLLQDTELHQQFSMK
ncbi:MAG: hypothetical protein ACE365_04435 [Gammaproteobacteria bacterium]